MSKLAGKIFVVDNLFTRIECENLIRCYDLCGPTQKWNDFFPMDIDLENDYLRSYSLRIQDTLNEFLSEKVEIDWCQIVKWPIGCSKNLHKDTTDKDTIFTSITYLNDDYDGGETFIFNDIKFIPKLGRTVFFDGVHYTHGVTEVKTQDRYALPVWYRYSTEN